MAAGSASCCPAPTAVPLSLVGTEVLDDGALQAFASHQEGEGQCFQRERGRKCCFAS